MIIYYIASKWPQKRKNNPLYLGKLLPLHGIFEGFDVGQELFSSFFLNCRNELAIEVYIALRNVIWFASKIWIMNNNNLLSFLCGFSGCLACNRLNEGFHILVTTLCKYLEHAMKM